MSEEKKADIDLSKIEKMPVGMNAIEGFFKEHPDVTPTDLRMETLRRIEKLRENPVISYMIATDNISVLPPQLMQLLPIQDADLQGFDQLIDSVIQQDGNEAIDVILVSNGGSPSSAERIVRLLRDNFESVRFILPGNAYSAATMMACSCDEIMMTDVATLGPIDPQLSGIPARAILRGMENLEERIKEEGPELLGAYVHLLKGYSLDLLEVCKDAEALSKELVREWLSDYMLKDEESKDETIEKIVEFFSSYDQHKTHARSIGLKQAQDVGLKVVKLERGDPLADLVRSFYDQTNFFFIRTPFIKLFESAHGVSWGKQVIMQQQPPPAPPKQ